jgi:hypothetical protein
MSEPEKAELRALLTNQSSHQEEEGILELAKKAFLGKVAQDKIVRIVELLATL